MNTLGLVQEWDVAALDHEVRLSFDETQHAVRILRFCLRLSHVADGDALHLGGVQLFGVQTPAGISVVTPPTPTGPFSTDQKRQSQIQDMTSTALVATTAQPTPR